MTARQLRCIGGPNDGEYHVVKPGLNYVPLIKATRPVAMSWFPERPTMADVMPPSASAVQTDYVVHEIWGEGYPFRFLAPRGMTFREAVELQFAKPDPPRCHVCQPPPHDDSYFYVCSECRGKR